MTVRATLTPFPGRQSFPFIDWVRLRRLAHLYDRQVQRRDLSELDDHLLRDLGLTREDVRRECAKSFWRA